MAHGAKVKSVADLLRLDGRVAVVTGGAGHIALAVGEAFAELGAHVVVVDLDPGESEARARDLTARFGVEALGIGVDVSDPAGARRIVDGVSERFRRVDIVVNNAAFTGASGLAGYAVPLPDQTLEAWDAAVGVNLTAAFQLCQAARPLLEQSGHGAILNVSSIYGNVGPNRRSTREPPWVTLPLTRPPRAASSR